MFYSTGNPNRYTSSTKWFPSLPVSVTLHFFISNPVLTTQKIISDRAPLPLIYPSRQRGRGTTWFSAPHVSSALLRISTPLRLESVHRQRGDSLYRHTLGSLSVRVTFNPCRHRLHSLHPWLLPLFYRNLSHVCPLQSTRKAVRCG